MLFRYLYPNKNNIHNTSVYVYTIAWGMHMYVFVSYWLHAQVNIRYFLLIFAICVCIKKSPILAGNFSNDYQLLFGLVNFEIW